MVSDGGGVGWQGDEVIRGERIWCGGDMFDELVWRMWRMVRWGR